MFEDRGLIRSAASALQISVHYSDQTVKKRLTEQASEYEYIRALFLHPPRKVDTFKSHAVLLHAQLSRVTVIAGLGRLIEPLLVPLYEHCRGIDLMTGVWSNSAKIEGDMQPFSSLVSDSRLSFYITLASRQVVACRAVKTRLLYSTVHFLRAG